MKSLRFAALILLCLALAFTGCSSKKVISRVDTNETIDLSGNWNDTDSRLVATEMISDALAKPWLVNFAKNKGQNPAVIVGYVKNLTDEHIPSETFVKDIERAFVNSGNVTVVASKSERKGVRDERADQQANASPESVKEFGMEKGADYMLLGEMSKITDQEGNEKVAFYQVDLTLTDLKTNEKVWIGQKKLKKYIARKPYKP